MNGFGDEIAKKVGRTVLVVGAVVILLLVAVFFLGRYSV